MGSSALAGGLEVAWLDVFTERPFGGNPLAVVLDADALPTDAMQTLAAEIGLSETIFVLDDARRLRIFTPGVELPLAGHPVVGASIELARRGRIPAEGTWTFATGVGDTPVELGGGMATMTQAEPEAWPELEPAMVAPLLGVEAADLEGPAVPFSTGVRFVCARVRDRATLAGVSADQEGIAAMDDPALGLVAWWEQDGSVAQRMFAPRMGIVEDPATGVAAGAVGALRVLQGSEPGPIVIQQGAELGRPSRIHVEVGGSPGAPSAPRVGGHAVLVMEGRLAPGVPPLAPGGAL
ncbi:MAG: PhzF family phenazine biosynthesis protein [Thermoleophilaceae bacterium]